MDSIEERLARLEISLALAEIHAYDCPVAFKMARQKYTDMQLHSLPCNCWVAKIRG